jgi:hypothetical protein
VNDLCHSGGIHLVSSRHQSDLYLEVLPKIIYNLKAVLRKVSSLCCRKEFYLAPLIVPILTTDCWNGPGRIAGNAHMTLEQFDHVCSAAAAVAGVKRVYVFGDTAIIPWQAQSGRSIHLPDFAPSREVDISAGDEKLDTLIDGSIGELSAFDETFAVYAHGVSLDAFKAPANWQQRTASRTEPVSGTEIIVPHPHDLIFSKLVAGRPKDFDFVVAAVKLFPITDVELDRFVQEFRQAYPEEEMRLRGNIETWKSRVAK